MLVPMRLNSYDPDDTITEQRTVKRLRTLERRQQVIGEPRTTGEVVRYLPIKGGYLVTSGREVLAKLWA